MESRFTHDPINKHHTPWHSLSLTLNNYFPQLSAPSPQILFFSFYSPHIKVSPSFPPSDIFHCFLSDSLHLSVFHRIKSCSFNLIDSLLVCYLWDLHPLNPSFHLCASLPSSLFPCSAVQISFLLSSFFISLLPFSLQRTRSLWSCPILIFLATSSFLFLISPFYPVFIFCCSLFYFSSISLPPPFFLSLMFPLVLSRDGDDVDPIYIWCLRLQSVCWGWCSGCTSLTVYLILHKHTRIHRHACKSYSNIMKDRLWLLNIRDRQVHQHVTMETLHLTGLDAARVRVNVG